jgi:hypothetical protein
MKRGDHSTREECGTERDETYAGAILLFFLPYLSLVVPFDFGRTCSWNV